MRPNRSLRKGVCGARKVLAFCNTVQEARAFATLLNAADVPAGHYNGQTAAARRKDVLRGFEDGGLRVLVTVDVLSEGVDLPAADTCLFLGCSSLQPLICFTCWQMV